VTFNHEISALSTEKFWLNNHLKKIVSICVISVFPHNRHNTMTQVS